MKGDTATVDQVKLPIAALSNPENPENTENTENTENNDYEECLACQ